MFEDKVEFLKGTPKTSENMSPEIMRLDLVRAIGREAVESVENRGLNWIFREQRDKYGYFAISARFQDGDHFVTVRSREVDLEDDGDRLVGVYRKGEAISLLDQYVNRIKTGVEVSFGLSDKEYEGLKAYNTVNEKLTQGSVLFLRELMEFASLIENNVFVRPTDNRRLAFYRGFFSSNKFDSSFRGTYFLFQPKLE